MNHPTASSCSAASIDMCLDFETTMREVVYENPLPIIFSSSSNTEGVGEWPLGDEEENFDSGDEYASNDTLREISMTILDQVDSPCWCAHSGCVGSDFCGQDCSEDMPMPIPQPTSQPELLGRHKCIELVSIQSYIEDDGFFIKRGEEFDCKKCDKAKMKNKMHARDHAYAKHAKDAPKRYKCLDCKFTTKSQSSMQRHQRNTGKKKARCPMCGKPISRLDYMPKHIERHCPKRPNCSSSSSTPATSNCDTEE